MNFYIHLHGSLFILISYIMSMEDMKLFQRIFRSKDMTKRYEIFLKY